ncbi:gas vesicle protein [Streptomyces sp. B1866]|uniref:gas vesicle protein GvpO n=1 Tax=Streptomyces sp. B1866 TaxID=3075431 RepID=UPI00289075C2|nr:gas vesicle protein [Streptomyces sp. B1866]MDT3400299.1 gas vesicle protein [Streptomyces sp. B1866]
MADSEWQGAEGRRRADRPDRTREERASEGGPAPSPVPLAQAMRSVTEEMTLLLGKPPEAVSAVKREGDGWQADVEVLEIERVPDTMSVMASYHVTLDAHGRLMEYERRRRYARGQVSR